MPFLTTISRNIMFRTIEWMPGKTVDDFHKVIDNVMRGCNGSGFTIRHVHADLEYKAVMDEVKTQIGVIVHCANKNQHVPEAERNNRTFKE